MTERTNVAKIGDLKPDQALPMQNGALSVRDTGTEVAVASNAAQAKAAVEVRYLMALRQPRNWDKVRQDILKECRRPGFAHNKSTYYIKPIGDGAEGLGIRFAEAALRCMTNVLIESTMQYADREKEVHRITVTDLEGNGTYFHDAVVSRFVERRQPNDDGTFISVRKNSYGKNVYLVVGTDDDLLNKRGALISKAIRTLALRLIPGDIQDEAEAVIKQIRLDKAAADPDAERKAIADGFLEIGVPAGELVAYLEHGLDTCSPTELVKLRGIFGAIRNGEATWAEVLDNKATEQEKKPAAAPKKAANKTVEATETATATETTELSGGKPVEPSTTEKPADSTAGAPRRRARPTTSLE